MGLLDGSLSGSGDSTTSSTSSSSDGGDGGFSWSDITKGDLKTKLGIGSLFSASALGISLIDNPVAFVKAVIAEWIIGGFLQFFGFLGAQMLNVWTLAADVIGGSVDAAIPGDLLANIPLDLLSMLSRLFTDLAAGLGPFAPFALIIMWAMAVLMAVGFIWLIWLIIKSLTTL